MADIKELIEKLADKIQKDGDIKELFMKEPIKAVEKVLGVDLPDDVVEKIIDAVKAKVTVEDAKDLLGSLKKLF